MKSSLVQKYNLKTTKIIVKPNKEVRAYLKAVENGDKIIAAKKGSIPKTKK